MKKRGKLEIKCIENIRHIIGRTSWDRSHAWAINPKAKYHFCNETLRPQFYQKSWTYSSCEKFTIFLTQAYYPIKGFSQFLKALPLVKRQFPNVKVFVGGIDFIHVSFIRKNGFTKYIERLIMELGLTKNIVFLGKLNADEMVAQYQKAHIFVSPSAIENSPNSIGESQLIGTPCISSYVGGTMDMILDGKTGYLYRFEETNLLAYRICQLFQDPELCRQISNNEKIAARGRHDPENNAKELFSIYESIIKNG